MTNSIYIQSYESPCGRLMLGSYEDRLCLSDWVGEKHREFVERRIRRLLNAEFKEATSAVIDSARRQLDEYFSGKRKVFDIPLLFLGTSFQKRVWQTLVNIPYGKTVSYSDLAKQIGMPSAVRAVANANRANAISIFVPCHRVIGSNGTLTGYAGGLSAKQYLLQLENAFNPDFPLFYQ